MIPEPTPTTSFLFTDVEGSTALWEIAPTAMSWALARHDDLVRAAIEACGGVVFKTVGDAFHAVFTSPLAAVEAAVAIQLGLLAEQWPPTAPLRVRVAIHTGDAEQRCGDYFGPTLNRVARMLSVAHGGQILVSGSTAASVVAKVAADMTLADLGEHRLKDLVAPERIYQICASGLPQCFPAVRCATQATMSARTSRGTVIVRRPLRRGRHPHAHQRPRALPVTRRRPSGVSVAPP